MHWGYRDEGYRCCRVVEARTVGAGCRLAQKTQGSVGDHLFHHIGWEEADAVCDPPRAVDAVVSRLCLLTVADSTTQWGMAARNSPEDKTAAASHRQVAVVAALQLVLLGLDLVAMVVQTHQKEASQEEHHPEQLTPARKQSWRRTKLAGKCTRSLSFCNLYICHPGSDYNHCIESRIELVSTISAAAHNRRDWE